jgi:hypothetical protein
MSIPDASSVVGFYFFVARPVWSVNNNMPGVTVFVYKVAASDCEIFKMFVNRLSFMYGEPDSSGSIVSGYGLGDRAIGVRSPAEVKGFFL